MTETQPAITLPAASASSDRVLPAMLLLFVLSGCAALIYEVVWLQMLQLVIGSTAVSMGVLLGTFMGGMCLGSLLLPRIVSSKAHPLRVYAVLELLIGISAIALLYVIPQIESVYTSSSAAGSGDANEKAYMISVAMRAVVAVAALLLPTFMMGATLPAMSRWISTTPAGISWLGFFYGGNIVGAVVGCLLAGFYLLRKYDMHIATYIAVGINVLVAVIGFVLASVTEYHPAPQKSKESLPPSSAGSKAVYLTIALSGFTGLGAEVVWTRQLSLMLGATVYTFSIILAVFLLGLGIGSSVGSMIARFTASPRVALGWCQALLVVGITWCGFVISHSLPWWPLDVETYGFNPWYVFHVHVSGCLMAILPAAVLWGASFPLALAGVAGRARDPGRLVGRVYSANTVGAIFGAALFSLFLVPDPIGPSGAEKILLGVCAVSALIVIIPALLFPDASATGISESRPVAATVSIVGIVAAAISLMFLLDPMPWEAVAFGRKSVTMRLPTSSAYPKVVSVDEAKRIMAMPYQPGDPYYTRFCLYEGYGANVSVAVTYDRDGFFYFHGAGKVQASSAPLDMRLQRLLGHVTALVHGNPKDVLVVACGAGVTAGSYVPYDSIESITICDIEKIVPTDVAMRFFGPSNHDVIKDKRTHVIQDDGRHFVRTTKKKFDVITSDPIDPWVKGCAALNTVEYYEMCKERLNEGGIMALWIPLYESDMATAKSVIGTFFKVFPDGILWSNDDRGRGYDAVLFGQKKTYTGNEEKPTKIDIDAIQAYIDSHEPVKKSLTAVGFGWEHKEAVDMFSTYAGNARTMKEWTKDAQINEDRNLVLQYLAGMAHNVPQNTSVAIFDDILNHYKFPDSIFSGSPDTIQSLKSALASLRRPERSVSQPPPRVDVTPVPGE